MIFEHLYELVILINVLFGPILGAVSKPPLAVVGTAKKSKVLEAKKHHSIKNKERTRKTKNKRFHLGTRHKPKNKIKISQQRKLPSQRHIAKLIKTYHEKYIKSKKQGKTIFKYNKKRLEEKRKPSKNRSKAKYTTAMS